MQFFIENNSKFDHWISGKFPFSYFVQGMRTPSNVTKYIIEIYSISIKYINIKHLYKKFFFYIYYMITAHLFCFDSLVLLCADFSSFFSFRFAIHPSSVQFFFDVPINLIRWFFSILHYNSVRTFCRRWFNCGGFFLSETDIFIKIVRFLIPEQKINMNFI